MEVMMFALDLARVVFAMNRMALSFDSELLSQGKLMQNQIYRDRTDAYAWLSAGVIFLLGLVSLWLSTLFTNKSLESVLSNLGGGLVAIGVLSAAWEIFAKRRFLSEIMDMARVAEDIKTAGVLSVTTDFNRDVRWQNFLENTKTLYIMNVGGATWRKVHQTSLEAIARQNGGRIDLLLPDPSNQEVIDELARQFCSPREEVIRRIADAETFFKGIGGGVTAEKYLRIWYISEAPLYTAYVMDKVCVMSTYRHCGQGQVPTIVCEKGGTVSDFLTKQIDALTCEAGPSRRAFPEAYSQGSTQTDVIPAPINISSEIV
jgi:hypothetical protein